MSQDQWTVDQVVLIHYLDPVNLRLQVDQMDLLQVIWVQDQMDQWDRHQKVTWQDLHQMVWVKCILIWMMQVHIMDQDLKDQMDLHQEQTWTEMEWLHLHHLMIHLMMWSKVF
jgi:hypothetical protein